RGQVRRRRQDVTGLGAGLAVELRHDRLAVDRQRHRLAYLDVLQERVLRAGRTALAVGLLGGVGEREVDLLDAAAKRGQEIALAAALDVLEDRPLHLEVPG